MNNLTLQNVIDAHRSEKPLEGLIEKAERDNNMIVKLGDNLRGVIPFDELYEKKAALPHFRIGTMFKFHVKEIHDNGELIILSPKDFAEELKNKIVTSLSAGRKIVINGVVVYIDKEEKKYALIDIGGGLTGMLYIRELCVTRLNSVEEMIKRNSCISVIVDGIDNRQRLILSTKALYGNYEDNLRLLDIKEGDTCFGIVRNKLADGNGYHVQLAPNLNGLADFPKDFFVCYGDMVSVRIRRVDRADQGLTLDMADKLSAPMDSKIPIPLFIPNLPLDGTTEDAGSFLENLVSGPAGMTVPNVEGMSFQKAYSLLKQQGCYIISRVEEPSLMVEKDRVIGTMPQKGRRIGKTETVYVHVSIGEPRKIIVPALNGLSVDEAEKRLKELNITYTIKREFNDEVQRDVVYDTNIAEGAEMAPDVDTLIIFLSKGVQNKEENKSFASYPNEEKIPDRSRYPKTIDELITLYHEGKMDDTDYHVLLLARQFIFIAVNQLTALLSQYYSINIVQDKLKKSHLDKLVRYGVLARYSFKNGEMPTKFQAYVIELNGSRFLYRLDNTLTFNNRFVHARCSPHWIKRHLSANQVYISYLLNPVFGKITAIDIDQDERKLARHMHLSFEKDGRSHDWNIEVVRRFDGFSFDMFIEKVTRYIAFYDALDKREGTEYCLVIVCEDEGHIFEVYEEMHRKGIYMRGVDIFYTCDLQHKPGDLSRLDNALVSLDYMSTIQTFIIK